MILKTRDGLPVPPPVMTATMPSTRKRDAASRLEVIVNRIQIEKQAVY